MVAVGDPDVIFASVDFWGMYSDGPLSPLALLILRRRREHLVSLANFLLFSVGPYSDRRERPHNQGDHVVDGRARRELSNSFAIRNRDPID